MGWQIIPRPKIYKSPKMCMNLYIVLIDATENAIPLTIFEHSATLFDLHYLIFMPLTMVANCELSLMKCMRFQVWIL